MKFVELHYKESNRKLAVNPLLISVVTVTEEGNTRIFYIAKAPFSPVLILLCIFSL